MVNTYILYSPTKKSYYIGACFEPLSKRLKNHNNGKYSGSYTSKANDWELYLSWECDDYAHAVRLERKIKSMKSKKYNENLKKYPEMREHILLSTKST